MRIAMVAPPWIALPPAGYGGIELVVADLSEALVRQGEEVLLFAPGDSRTSARLIPSLPRHSGQDWPWEIAQLRRRIGASGRDYFVAISHRQRQLYGDDLPWAGVVHNGINVDAAPFSAEKGDYLFFIGRANWEKGLDLAIRVAMRAGKRLVMAVKMTEERERVYYAEQVDPWLRRGGRIELLGEITQEERCALYRDAAGTLFTSQWEEPFGLTMVE